MRTIVVLCYVFVLSGVAFADGNPGVEIYIDFDPPNRVSSIVAGAYESVDAYVCLSNLDEGFCTVSFRLGDLTEEYPDCFAEPAFTRLLPGGLAIGEWNAGITLASTECMQGDVVPVACLTVLPLRSKMFCIEILDHPEYPGWVTGCNHPFGSVDFYCVRSHGSVNGGECAPGNCLIQSPVEETTWGSVKALFR